MMTKHIFITGSHRSGSSWIGKMLAAGGNFLIRDEEIFNCSSEIAASPIEWMYTHVSNKNENKYYPYIESLVEKRYSFLGGLRQSHTFRDIARVSKRKLRSIKRLLQPARPQIFIEPIGLFSAEWFAEKFDTHVIVVIRHPASFVSSLKRFNWGFNFSHLTKQEELMERYLFPFRKEMSDPPQKPDIIGMGILQWKLFYSVVHRYKEKHPEWIFIKQETLASDPMNEFKKLYQKLDLNFSDKAQEVIEAHTSEENSAEFSGKFDESKRNSRETTQLWKKRLTDEEMKRIRNSVANISEHFYDNLSWN